MRLVHKDLTMMQSCASAAKLRGGGPILRNGATPCDPSGDRHLGSSSETDDVLFVRLRELVLSALSRHAARKTTPAGTSPVVTMRHSAISSFLASATTRSHHAPQRDQQLSRQRHDQGLARAATGVGRARPVPLRQRTLLLMKQEAPGQLDHPAADAGVACLGEPFFAPPAAALVGGAGEARIAGDGSSITQGPCKNLMDQHVRCLNANAHNAREETNHDMRLFFRSLLQLLRAGLLNLFDLVHDEPQAGHVATKFEQRVGRERYPLGGPQRCETVRRVAQRRLEGPNPEADQTPLHPVDQARALTDEPLALTARALGILLRQRRNGRHVAVIGFAAQPADEDTFEQSRVEAICFRPAMLARDSHAGRVDDVGFDAAGPEPARQPEPVAARLEGDHDARNRATLLGCLGTPAHQQTEQFHFAWFELLQRMALDTWNNAGDEPTRLAHLDDRNDRAVLLQGSEGPA